MIEKVKGNKQLIVSIVEKGLGSTVVEASKKAGCEGGTILPGTGTYKDHLSFMSYFADPEKEIIFSIVDETEAEDILLAICEAASLNEPGNGVAFILNVNSLLGVAHLLDC